MDFFIFVVFHLVSLFAKGKQMIEVLNQFNIHAAAVGNHEFGNWSINQI